MTQEPPAPFEIKDSGLITLALGRTAHSLRELRDRVADVPIGSLKHHFLESLLRPSFDDPEFRNDFALWARDALRDDALAERLAVIDPNSLPDDDALRDALVEVLDDRLAEVDHPVTAQSSHAFQFLRSQIVIFATGLVAERPSDLARLAPGLSTGSVFFHFIDARLREPRGEDDFSAWLADWGEAGASARRHLAAIDPMFGSLVDLRERVAGALDACFGGEL